MSYLIAELFERHDRSRFEVSRLLHQPRGRQRHPPARDRGVRPFHHHQGYHGRGAARRIRADEIDILIDLNGLTTGTAYGDPALAAGADSGDLSRLHRPGADARAGLPALRRIRRPTGLRRALYLPQPLYVAPNYQANDSKRVIGQPMSPRDGRPAGRSFRLLLLLQPLQNHRGDVRRLDGDSAARAGTRCYGWPPTMPGPATTCATRAIIAGIDPARILFAGRVDPAEYMARLALPDLFLDTFPYNAGTIASDAIRMGLPLVTLQRQILRLAHGRPPACRRSAPTPGSPQTVGHYIETAVAWPRNPASSRATGRCSPQSNWAATIGDIATFTYHYEASLIQIELALRDPRATRAVR